MCGEGGSSPTTIWALPRREFIDRDRNQVPHGAHLPESSAHQLLRRRHHRRHHHPVLIAGALGAFWLLYRKGVSMLISLSGFI